MTLLVTFTYQILSHQSLSQISEKSIFMLLQNFGGAINYGPAKEVAHMEMNAGSVLKARLVEMRRRQENLIRDKLRFMHLFFVMGPFREGG